MTGKELEPLPPVVANLPSPREFAKILRERLEGEVLRVRQERGEVHAPEDTHALLRSLQGFREVAGEYARAWTGVAKVAGQEAEEELKSAVGEQEDVPNSGMDVPDTDGTTIKVTLDTVNDYTIDPEALRFAVAGWVTADADLMNRVREAAMEDAMFNERENLENVLAAAVLEGLHVMERAGLFTPQVSKVRALAKEIGGKGLDHLASVLTGAIHKKTVYKGVKLARQQPKEK